MAGRVAGPGEVRILEGSAHGTDLLKGAQREEVEGLILSFLERHR
jgi:hypothetical protein